MADDILQVFLSHTSELRAHPAGRSFVDAAVSAVLKVGWLPIDMEYFATRDEKPAAVCIEQVEKADILVGLLGFRWGSAVRDEPDKSYTELEFDTASRMKPPLTRLMFLLAGDQPLPIPPDLLHDENSKKQEAFRKRVWNEGLATTVANPDELHAALIHALGAEKDRRRRKADAERTTIGPATSPLVHGRAVRLRSHPADGERRAHIAGLLGRAGVTVSAEDGTGPLVVVGTYRAVATGMLGDPQFGPDVIVELDEDLAIVTDAVRVRAYDGTADEVAGRLRQGLVSFLPPEPVAVAAERATDPDALDQLTEELDFDPEHIAAFRADLRPERLRMLPAGLSDRQFLESCALMIGGRLTRAGVLLFGRRPERVLPTAMVQCTHYPGTDKTGVRVTEHMDGPIARQIELARAFVAERTGEGHASTYPMIAVREVLANALVHRDYDDRERTVHVRLFADRLEISSPGAWAGRTLPADQAQDLGALAGESRRRNFRLASALTWVNLVEGEGSGIPNAVADCLALDAPEPVVVRQDGFVKVVLRPGRRRDERPGSVWNVPARRVNFVGRDDLVQQIEDVFAEGEPAVVVLHGGYGVGKTATALEYVHRHADDYDVVWYVDGNRPFGIGDQLGGLGRILQFSGGPDDPDLAVILQGRRSLLVIDDVDDPSDPLLLLPAGVGQVLIIARLGGPAGVTSVAVGTFGRAESIELLRTLMADMTVDQADRLADASRDLPGEIVAVVELLHHTGLSVDDYLSGIAPPPLPVPDPSGPVD